MESKGFATRKVNGKTSLIILLLVAVPAFFWFRFLYNTYFMESITPEMQKMRDAMLHPHSKPASAPTPKHRDAKNPAVGPGEKGDTKIVQ